VWNGAMSGLRGQVALVTGAARGLGRAVCVRLAQEGVHIVGVDIGRQITTVDYPMADAASLDETRALVEVTGSRMIAVLADVRSSGQMQDAVDVTVREFGRLDIVLPNAAIAPLRGPIGEEEATWHDVIDVNLTGAWNTAHAALPAVIEGGRGGSVVFTNSTAGLRGLGGGTVAFCAYTAAKHALVGLARTLARDVGKHGIRVNTIHPAGINTPMMVNEAAEAFMAENTEFTSSVHPALPVGFMEPSDVSEAILWLVSDAARYVTGVALPVDAGCAL
jgi:SDR family mycofactocin-dependent oxidoreductase